MGETEGSREKDVRVGGFRDTIGFGRENGGGEELAVKGLPPKVGEDVAELDSEADMLGDVVGVDMGVVRGDGRVDDDGDEQDNRERMLLSWECSIMYVCSKTAYM